MLNDSRKYVPRIRGRRVFQKIFGEIRNNVNNQENDDIKFID